MTCCKHGSEPNRYGLTPFPKNDSTAAPHGIAHARCLINRFDHRYASPTFFTIANRIMTCLDRVDEIFDNPLMPANVAHDRRSRAGVLVCGFDLICEGGRIAQVETRDSVLLDAKGTFRAGNLKAPRIAGIRGGSCMQYADRAAGKLQRRNASVFALDVMHRRLRD